MTEGDPFSVETGHGAPATRTSGDRLMLLLAVVALVGGLLIAVGKLLPPGPAEVAEITPVPTALPSVSRTPRPSPTERPLGQLLVEPGEPPAFEPQPDSSVTWLRARETLVIRAIPQPNGLQVGTLAPGAVAIALPSPDGDSAVPGWLWLMEPGPEGWVAISAGSEEIVDVSPRQPGSVDLWETYGGETGFLARGSSDEGLFTATSADGVTWRRSDADDRRLFRDGRIVWGPAGWLTISSHDGPNGPTGTWIWQSDDGQSWTALGSLRGWSGGPWVDSLSGGPAGYLARLNFPSGTSTWWSSPNGLIWAEMPELAREADTVVGGPSGFYVLLTWQLEAAPDGASAAFTTGGDSWQVLDDGPQGFGSQVVPLDDGWFGTDIDPESGALRTWRGVVRDGVFAWDEPQAPSAFEGAALAVLAGGTDRATAITWDRLSEDVRAWITADGSTWTELSTPEGGFGVIPRQAATSQGDVLVIGAAYVNDQQTARLWRLSGDHWQEIRSPVIAEQPAPPAACPQPPADALDLAFLGDQAPRCFGDADLSVRAYSVRNEPCYGCDDGLFTPSWLSWAAPGLDLMPFETESNWFSSAALAPSLERSRDWDGAWVEVTGHFDDPAAADCRLALDPETEAWYTGRRQLIEECRRRFVVTEVTVVDGP